MKHSIPVLIIKWWESAKKFI